MKQRVWEYHPTSDHYKKEITDRIFKVTVRYLNREIKRKIILRESRDSFYSGLVVCGDLIMGNWSWDLKRFEHPVFLSNTVISTDGIHKRYVSNPIVAAVEGVVRSTFAAA